MADICAVCNKKIGMFTLDKIQGVVIHDKCREVFLKNPEKYGGKAIKRKEPEIAQESEPQSNKICPVCNKKMSQLSKVVIQEGITIHDTCIQVFEKGPEKYGGKAIENTEVQTEAWEDQDKAPSNSEPSDKDFVTTLLICIFLGGLGGHRFFVDKQETAIAMLVMPIVAALIFEFLAFGLGILLFVVWGLWYLIDLLQIVTSSFEDSEGRVIAYQAAGATNTAPSTHVPEKVVETPPAKDIPDEIRKFAELKKDGLITEEEFDKKKKELLK
jgi:hypothetical protein